MTLLLGALLSMIVQLIKWTIKKFGQEFTRWFVLVLVFLISLIFAILKEGGVITPELTAIVVKIFISAIAVYEVIFKTLLLPIWSKVFPE